MAGKPFMDIPREKIPWYPTIDVQKCQNCGNCMDFCTHGVYDQGEQTVLVAHPFECVIGCHSCQRLCSNEAIRFPLRKS